MQALHLNTQDLTAERINFLHPGVLNTENIFTAMEYNFNMTDEQLFTLLDLTEVTDENESLLDHSGHRCYIKSYTIHPDILQSLTARWLSIGLFTTVAHEWQRYLEENPGKNLLSLCRSN